MVISCSAFGCIKRFGDSTIHGGKVSFHKFPLNSQPKVKMWLSYMKRKDFYPSSSSMICSEHFKKECFEVGGITRRLRENAVPTEFSFSKSYTSQSRKKPMTDDELDSESDDTPDIFCAAEIIEPPPTSPVSSLCRVCAQSPFKLISLFGEEAQKRSLILKLTKCLPILVTQHDVLPTSVCEDCVEWIESSYSLYDLSLMSQAKLTEMWFHEQKTQHENSQRTGQNRSEIRDYRMKAKAGSRRVASAEEMGLRRIVCNTCGTFVPPNMLGEPHVHRKFSRNVVRKGYCVCHLCDESFDLQASYKNHMAEHSSESGNNENVSFSTNQILEPQGVQSTERRPLSRDTTEISPQKGSGKTPLCVPEKGKINSVGISYGYRRREFKMGKNLQELNIAPTVKSAAKTSVISDAKVRVTSVLNGSSATNKQGRGRKRGPYKKRRLNKD